MGNYKTIKQIFIGFLALTSTLISCKKEPRENTDTSNSSIYGRWGLTTEFEELYYINQLVESNTYDFNPDDETVEFLSNGTVNFYEEDTLEQTYTFTYANNEVIIFDDEDSSYNDTLNVKTVTAEQLVLVQEWDEPSIGELYRTTLTFIRK
jgi:hypothetical protein